ncbi:MAG: heavy-metal-associated domain-containing protein [Ktedonobacterales bacterium]
MAQIAETILSVPDISCEHCVKTINGALGALPGIETVQTDIPSKSVRLRYDEGQVTMEKIEATLDDAGYTLAK